MNRTTVRGARKHTFTSPHSKLNLIRFNNRNSILAAIREGRAELAIARNEGAWEEVSRIEEEIECLTEILSDIYL